MAFQRIDNARVPLAAAASADHTIPRSSDESLSTTAFEMKVHISFDAISPAAASAATFNSPGQATGTAPKAWSASVGLGTRSPSCAPTEL